MFPGDLIWACSYPKFTMILPRGCLPRLVPATSQHLRGAGRGLGLQPLPARLFSTPPMLSPEEVNDLITTQKPAPPAPLPSNHGLQPFLLSHSVTPSILFRPDAQGPGCCRSLLQAHGRWPRMEMTPPGILQCTTCTTIPRGLTTRTPPPHLPLQAGPSSHSRRWVAARMAPQGHG